MRILLVSYTGYGAWFTLRLQAEGHRVDYYLIGDRFANILLGIAPKPLKEKPDFAKYDLVLFDLTGKPGLAEQSKVLAPTIGDSKLASHLEDDRVFGIEIMEECGIEVPPYEVFLEVDSAKKFVEETDKKYVFKPNGGQGQDTASTYVSSSAEDMISYLDDLVKITHNEEFILQEVVEGTEVSTEAWFNGNEFFLINSTLEEKKFMEGGKGPNTGCAGNMVWTYGQEPSIFKRGLKLLQPFLENVEYVGMIDLNTIANESHLYGLEWTPRLGYDAASTLFSLLSSNLGEFLYAIATGITPNIDIKTDFSASVRLSIPPYPSECNGYYHEDVPISGIEPEDIEEIYLYDVKMEKSKLLTAGCSGFVAVPIGCGKSIEEAWSVVKEKVKKIKIPDMQYRQDLYRQTKERYDELAVMGWLR